MCSSLHRGCGLKIIGRSVCLRISSYVFKNQLLMGGMLRHCKLLSCCPHNRICLPSLFQGFKLSPSNLARLSSLPVSPK